MKKDIFFGFAILLLTSCTQVNTSSDKLITQGGDTVAEMDISFSKMDAVEELSDIDDSESNDVLFKASGTEPGWFAEFSANKLRLLVDYGKDSLILIDKFEGLDDKEGYLFGVQGEKDINKNVSVYIVNKPCVDAGSGDKMTRQVYVTFKGKKYSGCGDFIK
jgi:uncharacterized membrane protein